MKTKFNGLTGFFNDVQIKAGQLGKIIIYCDSQAFLELVTVWLKTMLLLLMKYSKDYRHLLV